MDVVGALAQQRSRGVCSTAHATALDTLRAERATIRKNIELQVVDCTRAERLLVLEMHDVHSFV